MDKSAFLRKTSMPEDLQLKGLTGMEEKNPGKEIKIRQNQKHEKVPAFQHDSSIYSNLDLDVYKNNTVETIKEEKFEISNTREITSTYANKIKTASHIEELESTINSMISKYLGMFTMWKDK